MRENYKKVRENVIGQNLPGLEEIYVVLNPAWNEVLSGDDDDRIAKFQDLILEETGACCIGGMSLGKVSGRWYISTGTF